MSPVLGAETVTTGEKDRKGKWEVDLTVAVG